MADVRFLLGIQQTGLYRLDVVPEALPRGSGADPNLIECTTVRRARNSVSATVSSSSAATRRSNSRGLGGAAPLARWYRSLPCGCIYLQLRM